MPAGREYRGLWDVKRCDFAAFLYRMADLLDDDMRNDSVALSNRRVGEVLATAVDCYANTPHAAEVAWLIDSGISRGWSDDGGRTLSFKPYARVARQDMAAFIYRFVDLADDGRMDGSPERGYSLVIFTDVRSTVEANGGINGKRVAINSGIVKASGEGSVIFGDIVTISGREVTVTASNGNGISSNSTNDGPGTVTISGGIVSVTGGANGSGIYTENCGGHEPPGNVKIDGGIASVTASGGKQAIEGIVTNAVSGMGWTDAAGTPGKALIEINTDQGQTLSHKKVQFPAPVAQVTTAPKATNPTYNGNAQELVTAGTAEGGTMQYSLDGET